MSEETTTAPARGRPRPDETKERDARVYEYLKANPSGATRKQLVEALPDLTGSQIYLSLYRVRAAGGAAREGSIWKAVPEA